MDTFSNVLLAPVSEHVIIYAALRSLATEAFAPTDHIFLFPSDTYSFSTKIHRVHVPEARRPDVDVMLRLKRKIHIASFCSKRRWSFFIRTKSSDPVAVIIFEHSDSCDTILGPSPGFCCWAATILKAHSTLMVRQKGANKFCHLSKSVYPDNLVSLARLIS